MSTLHHTRRVATAARSTVVALALALVAGCTDGSDAGSPSTQAPSTTESSAGTASGSAVLAPLRAIRGDQPRIVDDEGRQVILRGVNLNSLGDYYQGDPDAPTVVPVTDDDWADMSALGFNVVRLLVSWSKLEPERGTFDEEYLATVEDAVAAAADHGIYTVIDMHQDAWGKYIASPEGETCPGGGDPAIGWDGDPAIGWDGAPEWATLTDGASTCTFGSRESSEAVKTAWDSFYANRDGIQDELVATWAFVAEAFADNPNVAGFDLLNEPNNGSDQEAARPALGAFYDRAIDAIRAAEQGAGGFSHIAFFETTVSGLPVPADFTDDDNIVFAPHNYGESIGPIPIEATFDYFASLAKDVGTAVWVGEYGFFEDTDAASEKLTRYAAKEDALITAGGTWWQWRQACGDPHSVGRPGGRSGPIQIHLRTNGCPGDVDGGVNPRWACLWRPYPRAAAGIVTKLSGGCAGGLELTASTSEPGTVEVWSPANEGDAEPDVTGEGLSDVDVEPVEGGFRITAAVTGEYSVTVTPA